MKTILIDKLLNDYYSKEIRCLHKYDDINNATMKKNFKPISNLKDFIVKTYTSGAKKDTVILMLVRKFKIKQTTAKYLTNRMLSILDGSTKYITQEEYDVLKKHLSNDEKYTSAFEEYSKNPYKKNLCKKNPVEESIDVTGDAVEIYDDILAIEAKKGKKSLFKNEKFRHDFKKGAQVLGLDDGSILIRSKRGKKLWKTFDGYTEGVDY